MDGVNYNFVSREAFERMIDGGELLEYAEYVGNYYGTSLKIIRDYLDQGTDVLLDIEVQGAEIVKEKCPEAVLIFILPPSLEALAQRLQSRNTDSADTIALRLERAKEECGEISKYDYLVVNDSVVAAVSEITSILTAENCRLENRGYLVNKITASAV